MPRRLAMLLLLALGLAATAEGAGAQERAVRFEITETQDTTFSFSVGRYPWVTPGLTGIVVDPRRRDALVAGFRVVRVDAGLATAVVTGQATTLNTTHAALLDEPRRAFWKQRHFWLGMLFGAGAGVAVGSAL